MQVHFQHHQLYLLPIAIGAVLIAYWLYVGFSKRHESSLGLVWFFRLLRSLVLVVIGALLLVPFVRLLKTYSEKPVLAVGYDNSQSLNLLDTTGKRKLQNELDQVLNDLNEKYEVETYLFGESVAPGDWELSDKRTNISDWLNFLSKNYRHGNLGASLLISDGIFNLGGNPSYATMQIKAPLYSIALGDTTPSKDLRVSFVNNNDIAYLGNQFPIKVGVVSEKMKGEEFTMTLLENGKKINSESFAIKSDDFFKEHTFIIDADEAGMQKYEISLSRFDDELSTSNNYQQSYVEVIDADKNILIAYKAPHPDVAALRKSIERNKNYQVETWWAAGGVEEQPDFSEFHLAILHNLPDGKDKSWQKDLRESNVSTLYFIDNAVQWQALNNQLSGLSITPKSNQANEAYGVVNNDFVGFSLDKGQLAALSDYPPLRAAFANMHFSTEHDVLLFQKIGTVNTAYPMFAVWQNNSRKTGVFSATGIWRWFVYDYSENGNNEVVDELISQSVQYLSLKEDKRRLRLNRNKLLFNENEDIELTASFYDKNYQPAANGQLKLNVWSEDDVEYEFGFLKRGDLFEVNAGQLKPGEYRYKITASLGDDVHFLNGGFTVAAVNVEYMQPKANHQVLYSLTQQYNGDMFYPNQIDQLSAALKENDKAFSIRHEKAEVTELIHNKWLFFLILSLLTIEWTIRKYKGAS